MSASNPRLPIRQLPNIVQRLAGVHTPRMHAQPANLAAHASTNSVAARLDEWVRWSA